LVLALPRELDIELDPGSNCPGRVFCSGRSAFAAVSGFLTFCAALAFARSRALAFVMSFSFQLPCPEARQADTCPDGQA